MSRKMKVVSKKEGMVDASMKIWCALREFSIFERYQAAFLSIF